MEKHHLAGAVTYGGFKAAGRTKVALALLPARENRHNLHRTAPSNAPNKATPARLRRRAEARSIGVKDAVAVVPPPRQNVCGSAPGIGGATWRNADSIPC